MSAHRAAFDHTSELVRAPRRKRATRVREQAMTLLMAGRILPAETMAAPRKLLPSVSESVQIQIYRGDSQAAAFESEGLVGVLVFGSSTRPGGGWETGAKAQEEDISLAGTWAVQATAAEGFYQRGTGLGGLGPDAGLVAPGFWLTAPDGSWLAEPRSVVFAGVAAPNLAHPETAGLPEAVLVDHLARRLVVVLDAWQRLEVSSIVMGAIGCGVFRWPAAASAEALRMALAATTWRGPMVLALPDPAMEAVFQRGLAQEHAQGKRPTP